MALYDVDCRDTRRERRIQARTKIMEYIKGSAYKASVLEMTSAGVSPSHPAFRHAFTKATEHEEAAKIAAQVDKRMVSVRRKIARITAVVNGQRELASELKGYRRYLSSGFLDTFAAEADKLYEDEISLECAEAELSQHLPAGEDYDEGENELLVRWQLEGAPVPSRSPITPYRTGESSGVSPKSPQGPSDATCVRQ
ncbi:minor tegument protein [Psittacid alphaherpesvirus 1]|uniref:Tegument protein UL14 n=1 Tax=Psittacid herpesvirus 1 (isolate Amazon parrot/-/97-0001/1997) TaxID=670426 RepID=TEG3_PSHV1|nr:tegument protein UL14 [Psittacid alphaherpesvirus 1]Q6UDH8.1 RecName: Full=Tegument protein UL14 [Psittacid herpesvirus 1 Amazon parrot/1997]AAQ73732.1 minor tegument protein [Psittacid alphaherpesvirus 1]